MWLLTGPCRTQLKSSTVMIGNLIRTLANMKLDLDVSVNPSSDDLHIQVLPYKYRVDDKARVMNFHLHTQTQCLLESWHIQREHAPLNREKGTLPEIYATLLEWQWQPTCVVFACHDYLIIINIITAWRHILLFSHCTFILNIPTFVFPCSPLTFTSHDLSPSVIHPVFIYMAAPVCINHYWWRLP